MESYEQVDGGVLYHCRTDRDNPVSIRLSICTPHILRFQIRFGANSVFEESLLEVKKDWPPSAFDVSEAPETVVVDTGAVRFEAHREPWRFAVYDASGEPILAEHIRDLDAHFSHRSLPPGFVTEDGAPLRATEAFSLPPGEHFYGFGEKFTRLNKLGQRIDSWNKNPFGAGSEESHKNIPFFMSSRGYGVFVNTTHRVTYEVGSRSLMSFNLTVDEPRLDLFIIYGPSLKDVIGRYQEITGRAPLPPRDSFGIWHTPYRPEKGIGGVADIARKFRELDIPVDNFMVMSLGTSPGSGPRELEEAVAMTREVSDALMSFGVKTHLYITPMMNLGSKMEREARERGYAITREDGSPYEVPLGVKSVGERGDSEYSLAMLDRDDAWRDRHNRIFYDPCLLPDFTNPEVVKWWKDRIVQIMQAGCAGIGMSDFGEDVPADANFHNGRSGLEMHNIYTLLYQKATFEAVEEGTGERGLVNARSGTAGLQRYPICWSGDPNCEWEDMLTNMRAGLSIGLSGVPFWCADNGGFSATVGHLTPELWTRWSQWSMFQSHVRLHGTLPLRAPWTFGEKALQNFRRYAKLRYRLLPYIYSQAYNATKTGLPMMRAMVLEFQEDPNTYDMEDQYMFGDAFLVAPVYTPVNRRTVYLPEGTWFDYWTGERLQGPATLHIQPPLDLLPLYIRGDSIIPMGPDMKYVGEKPFDPITLDIWLVSEAECTVYDDDEMVTCRAKRNQNEITLELSASNKSFVAKLNDADCPTEVVHNGVVLPRFSSQPELQKSARGWYFDPLFTVYVKFAGLQENGTVSVKKRLA